MGGCGVFGILAGMAGILLFVSLLGLVVWAVVSISPARGALRGRPGRRTDPAEETLRGRFARGELAAGEFEKALRILRGEPVHDDYEDFTREARER